MKAWLIVSCTLAISACDKPDTRGVTARPTTGEQGYLAKVTRLPEGQVRGVLYRAIIDGGADCPQVTTSKREPDQNGRAVWSARCSNGGRWIVAVGDDGIAQASGLPPGQ